MADRDMRQTPLGPDRPDRDKASVNEKDDLLRASPRGAGHSQPSARNGRAGFR